MVAIWNNLNLKKLNEKGNEVVSFVRIKQIPIYNTAFTIYTAEFDLLHIQ